MKAENVTVNNFSTKYEELSDLELEAVAGGGKSRSKNSSPRDDKPQDRNNRGRTTTVMGIRG